MFRFFQATSAIGIAIVVLTPSAHGASLATFTTNTEGWVAASVDPYNHVGSDPSTTPATWDGINGQPAGSLRLGDVYGWTWIQAPSSWLGNRSSAFGLAVSWDIFLRVTDNIPYPAIALRGRNTTLYCNTASPGVASWTPMSATLTGSNWRVNNYDGGVPATDDQLKQVLRDLRGIYILTEWHTGDDDTNVDNIEFPGSIGVPCKGDVNLDGKTSVADFNILAGNFATAVTPYTNGDLTGDGFVNVADFNILAGDFTCGA